MKMLSMKSIFLYYCIMLVVSVDCKGKVFSTRKGSWFCNIMTKLGFKIARCSHTPDSVANVAVPTNKAAADGNEDYDISDGSQVIKHPREDWGIQETDIDDDWGVGNPFINNDKVIKDNQPLLPNKKQTDDDSSADNAKHTTMSKEEEEFGKNNPFMNEIVEERSSGMFRDGVPNEDAVFVPAAIRRDDKGVVSAEPVVGLNDLVPPPSRPVNDISSHFKRPNIRRASVKLVRRLSGKKAKNKDRTKSEVGLDGESRPDVTDSAMSVEKIPKRSKSIKRRMSLKRKPNKVITIDNRPDNSLPLEFKSPVATVVNAKKLKKMTPEEQREYIQRKADKKRQKLEDAQRKSNEKLHVKEYKKELKADRKVEKAKAKSEGTETKHKKLKKIKKQATKHFVRRKKVDEL